MLGQVPAPDALWSRTHLHTADLQMDLAPDTLMLPALSRLCKLHACVSAGAAFGCRAEQTYVSHFGPNHGTHPEVAG